jgi:hypothetical protein
MANVPRWRKNACNFISHIADEQFQRDNWFGKGKYISSPDEMYNEVFDDILIEEFLVSPEVGLNDQQRAAGKRFVDAMNAFDKPMNSLTSEQIIDHTMWREVRKAAKEFLDLLECEKYVDVR